MFKNNWIAASMSFGLMIALMHVCPLQVSAQSLEKEFEESEPQPIATPDELSTSWMDRTERLGDAEVFVQAPNKFLFRSGLSKNPTNNKFLTLSELRHELKGQTTKRKLAIYLVSKTPIIQTTKIGDARIIRIRNEDSDFKRRNSLLKLSKQVWADLPYRRIILLSHTETAYPDGWVIFEQLTKTASWMEGHSKNKLPNPDPQVASIAEVQMSHIASNAPDSEAAFRRLLLRDLKFYFVEPEQKLSIDYELLRDGPSQSGVAYPKYYVWIHILDGATVVEEGAVKVSAIEGRYFEIRDYVSKADIQTQPEALSKVFPSAVVEKIRSKVFIDQASP